MNVQIRKAIPYLLLLVMAALIMVLRKCNNEQVVQPKTRKEKTNTNSGTVNRDRGFDRRITFLEYSEHARCRMSCRKITQKEVEDIMQTGRINYNKSDLQNARCPRYAVEGITDDEQRVRIVFAQCNEKTTVVTVIDLETEWTCHCPGDDKKYDNKN